MRIYEMTATFGKLENAKLTLEPGLNIIEAPNEWGKSSWCAFLSAMLYGLETRAKSTKTTLADKDRYAPWSGSPMAGRIDLCWQGRDITLERGTRRRVPLGEFRAYETHTGLNVAELTPENCGKMLLGVERSVFRRAGLIRFSDLPVTQDEDLRRRLNALVSTGDESADAEHLALALRELRNRCRYNRTGLLPQAEQERAALEEKLRELGSLHRHCVELQQRLEEQERENRLLENHERALAYEAAREDARQLEEARQERDRRSGELQQLLEEAARLPSREQAAEKLEKLEKLRRQWAETAMERQQLPPEPRAPEIPEVFRRADAELLVRQDAERYRALGKIKELGWYALGIAMLAAGAAVLLTEQWLPGGVASVLGIAALAAGFLRRGKRRREQRNLAGKYGSREPEQWLAEWERCHKALEAYSAGIREDRAKREALERRLAELRTRQEALCALQTPEEVTRLWQQVAARWDALEQARREACRAEQLYETLWRMTRHAEPPAFRDTLTHTAEQTRKLLEEGERELQRLQNRLGHYRGRMEALGSPEELESQLTHTKERIARLEDTWTALTIALDTLTQARQELQRRFAPRIVRRAGELMHRLTDGRYTRLRLEEDFSILAAADSEQTLQSLLWRSDGTADQLYLALRLAVAAELTPGAPLILDDALVRFDDRRLKRALEILLEEAEERQVLLFTCQSRERILLEKINKSGI